MNADQRDPMEQLHDERDYGYGYRGQNSPQQHQTVNLGGAIAIAMAMLAFGGVLVGAIILPQLADRSAKAYALEITQPLAVKVASAQDMAYLAERETKLTSERVRMMEVELEKKDIHIPASH